MVDDGAIFEEVASTPGVDEDLVLAGSPPAVGPVISSGSESTIVSCTFEFSYRSVKHSRRSLSNVHGHIIGQFTENMLVYSAIVVKGLIIVDTVVEARPITGTWMNF